MSQWKNTDAAANSVFWAPATVKTVANSTTQAALFGNTTADAFISDQTIGMFGVDTTEATVEKAVTHAGWVLRTEGSGGRANRVQYETLVAMGSLTGDAEDAVMRDAKITIVTQPASQEIDDGDPATFGIVVTAVPTNATVTYVWQANTGSGFANLSNAGVYSNTTTATMSISDVTGLDAVQYRALALSTGGDTVTSNAAILTVNV